jgi:hypothetical protein
MYYNVVIKDKYYEDIGQNVLVFTFYEFEEAINFAKEILNISKYHVEILQFDDDSEK